MENPKRPGIRIDDIMIDCGDEQKLGAFYAGLLVWEAAPIGEGCVAVSAPGGALRILCQGEADYAPPVWPETPGTQQKMMHLDFTVDDLAAAVRLALSLGATMAQTQYRPDQWRTLLDPAGHPFCLCLPEA
ncbi:MAG: VOC family protein [Bacillota bacterium]